MIQTPQDRFKLFIQIPFPFKKFIFATYLQLSSHSNFLNSFKEKLTPILERLFVQAVSSRSQETELNSLLNLEQHWTEIVNIQKVQNKRQSEQQEALWEIVSTERRYILQLQLLEDLEWCLIELQRQGYLRDINRHCVFLNYSQLLRCNLHFWASAIGPMLQKSR